MNVYILFVILATLGGCTATNACGITNCYICNTVTLACNQCDSGLYVNLTTNTCHVCGGAPCRTGYYYLPAACASHHPFDDGCKLCQDCVENYGERTKQYGVCGGPAPYTYHPDPDVQKCMNPGPALCEACSAYIPEWGWTQSPIYEFNISYCDNNRDDSWWYLGGKTETDLINCCQAAYDLEGEGECVFSYPDEVLSPAAAHKSCLYNHVVSCMGIYDANQGGWPLAHQYPDDPMPW